LALGLADAVARLLLVGGHLDLTTKLAQTNKQTNKLLGSMSETTCEHELKWQISL
jgi:hypothetical protein